MSHRQKFIVGPVLLMLVVLLGALAFVAGHSRRSGLATKPIMPPSKNQFLQGQGTREGRPRVRNLSLQPEAFNMGRRLGQRFSSAKRDRSMLAGTLTIGSLRRAVETTRSQTDHGEQVEIQIAGTPGALTWDAAQGALSSGSRATGEERALIERLVLDSPDQFVLAQLRGASYFTVARNVRPVEAGDNYNGPLWNIIRVGDPEPDEVKRPESRWRLYYLNVVTGLIERVESEVQGQRIVAEISGWVEQNGEKIPTSIVWTRQGQTLMQYSLTNFSRTE